MYPGVGTFVLIRPTQTFYERINLVRLRDDGRVRHLGLTNFDTATLERIVGGGFGIVSNQVQYSLVDLRPEVKMAEFCEEHGIRLLSYGSLCGGLLTDSYLGQREPTLRELNTVSLRKYKQMIDAWGGWALFQELLTTLSAVASKHGVSSANVAVRYILDRPAVAGVIVGVRLGLAEHREDNARVFDLSLSAEDRERIQAVTNKANDLYAVIGDCGDDYRR